MSIKASELVLASDGSLYHIHQVGETLADDILLVGDPNRVDMFKDIFESIERETQNREIHVLTGRYHGKRFTALSTGMGCDNMDIVVTELDAAVNIDLFTRMPLKEHRTLNMVRIGTCGSLQEKVDCGSLIASRYAIGMDGLMNYYQHSDEGFEHKMEVAFVKHMQLDSRLATPYCVRGSKMLLDKIGAGTHKGITVTAPGFYGPQGRNIRLVPTIVDLNEKLSSFVWNNTHVTNLEMETSALYGFANALGHNAMTICLVVANRVAGTFLSDYHTPMKATIGRIVEALV